MDQAVRFLDEGVSVIDNYLRLNPEQNEQEAYASLATFLFRNKSAHKMIAQLSGGERLRVGLACTLMSKIPPQCLILDEPSDHLDFDSLASIESALRQFQGALVVVSHDEVFLQNIGVERQVTL